MRKFIDIVESAQPENHDEFFARVEKIKAPKGLKSPRPEDLDLINQAREHIRQFEGLGGMCHEVSEWIDHRYGWERQSGTYLSGENGEPVCTYHFWNELPDGSILDSTPDQHGEDDREIRIIHPTDPEWRRYTCEWMEDWHPGHPDYDPDWRREKRDPARYSGSIDADREDELKAQHGGDRWWHVQDRTHVDAYKAKEASYAAHAEETSGSYNYDEDD